MNNLEFVNKAKEIAMLPTMYMWGTYGAIITDKLVEDKVKQYPERYSYKRQYALYDNANGEYRGFDCCGLIKAILWGFDKTKDKPTYHKETDLNVSGLKANCVCDTDFNNIESGELVFKDGHVGIYAGNCVVIEATLRGEYDGVVLTELDYSWREHGKLKFIEYVGEDMKLKLHVQSVGLRVRDSLTFSGKKPTGKVKAFCPVGGDMDVVEIIPGIQKDGYQWFKTKYGNVTGFSQYDSMCYYLYTE